MRIFVALLLVVVAVSADFAPLLHGDSPTRVPGSYIVVLNNGLTALDRDAHINALKRKTNTSDALEVGFLYGSGSFVGFSAKMSDSLLKAELAHPDVKYIEVDQVVSINYEQAPRAPQDIISQTGATWGLIRTSQRTLNLNQGYLYDASAGKGVDAYVIDTGIYVAHYDFSGRAVAAYNAVTNEANDDLNGHGTHCAGTIGGTTYGVAKKVNVFGVKVLNAGGSGTTAGVAAGVNYVTNSKSNINPSIASMSLGGGASTVMDDAVAASIASGVSYAIAAGNSAANACNYSPARVPTAVTVGATTNTDARASYSNFGTCVKIFAPGSSITSAWIGSPSATNTISGTSMATPHVAGVVALELALAPTLTPTAVLAKLVSIATPNVVGNPGVGSPNLLLFSNPQQ